MGESGYYPPGADTPSAPWRQKDNEEKEFEVTCSQTLSKTTTVFTSNYEATVEKDYDGETMFTNVTYDTPNTNWEEEYHDCDHYTPIQLIELFQKYLLDEINGSCTVSKNRQFINHIITECNNWTEDETEYIN